VSTIGTPSVSDAYDPATFAVIRYHALEKPNTRMRREQICVVPQAPCIGASTRAMRMSSLPPAPEL
jgi:hypothetical protein